MGQVAMTISHAIIGSMAAEAIEIRMARLEGTNTQINERLGAIEDRLGAIEQRLTSEIAALRADMNSGQDGLRRQITGQFYWLLTLILGSILIPFLRDLAR
jgi:predicted PurR-regulated permease PerM